MRELSEWNEGHLMCAALLTLSELNKNQIDELTSGNTQVNLKLKKRFIFQYFCLVYQVQIIIKCEFEFTTVSGFTQNIVSHPVFFFSKLCNTFLLTCTFFVFKAKILIYCRSGNRAGVAVGMVEGWGYTNVNNIGGYTDIVDKCGDCGAGNGILFLDRNLVR